MGGMTQNMLTSPDRTTAVLHMLLGFALAAGLLAVVTFVFIAAFGVMPGLVASTILTTAGLMVAVWMLVR